MQRDFERQLLIVILESSSDFDRRLANCWDVYAPLVLQTAISFDWEPPTEAAWRERQGDGQVPPAGGSRPGRPGGGSLHAQLVALGTANALARIALPNARSVALYEGVGYTPLGVYEKVGFKFGQWRDVGWWQKQLQPQGDEPKPPKGP